MERERGRGSGERKRHKTARKTVQVRRKKGDEGVESFLCLDLGPRGRLLMEFGQPYSYELQ